jgi:hypothetical protein
MTRVKPHAAVDFHHVLATELVAPGSIEEV